MSEVAIDSKGVVLACASCGQRNRIAYSSLNAGTRCGKCKAALPPVSEPINVDSEGEFELLIGSGSLPVLVDFWAEWCGPCKMVAPEIAKVAAQAAGRLIVAKVNTEHVPGLAQRFQVSSIPSLAVFMHGREAGRIAGARPAAGILAFVREHAAV
jgi:thioredoxin 2